MHACIHAMYAAHVFMQACMYACMLYVFMHVSARADFLLRNKFSLLLNNIFFGIWIVMMLLIFVVMDRL